MMSIAILGARGQLGSELCYRLGAVAAGFSHQELDITDAAQLEARLSPLHLRAVVNCAAYNAVELAETEFEAAFRLNAIGPATVAKFCHRQRIPLVHVSTDYVFGLAENRTVPYREDEPPGPLSVYAVSKLAGEELVRAHCPRHFILRTCGLYGFRGSSGKRNFVEMMLHLGRQKPELRVICDQFCTPTATHDLAEAIVELLATSAYGTYHAVNSGSCSWAEFATEIFRQANLITTVDPIPASEYGAKVRRPAYSVLDNSKLAAVLGRPWRSWQQAVADYLANRPTKPS